MNKIPEKSGMLRNEESSLMLWVPGHYAASALFSTNKQRELFSPKTRKIGDKGNGKQENYKKRQSRALAL